MKPEKILVLHGITNGDALNFQSLASIFQDLLANTKDDYLRAVRALFREIVRAVRHDMTFTEFAMGLMSERTDAKVKDIEQQHKVSVIMEHVRHCSF